MTAVHLLDVNVLVALFDGDHVHHDAAHDWFTDHRADGWATSVATESGFVRVVSNPAYGLELRVVDAVTHLRRFCASGHHEFWPDAVPLRDDAAYRLELVRGYRQVTDVTLLALAVRMGGRLATFDRTIPVEAVAGSTREALTVIGAVES